MIKGVYLGIRGLLMAVEQCRSTMRKVICVWDLLVPRTGRFLAELI